MFSKTLFFERENYLTALVKESFLLLTTMATSSPLLATASLPPESFLLLAMELAKLCAESARSTARPGSSPDSTAWDMGEVSAGKQLLQALDNSKKTLTKFLHFCQFFCCLPY